MSKVLQSLKNSSRPKKARRRVGRGTGSGVGKTCGRGIKGAGARSGYKRRYGTEGGQAPLFTKLPTRGFTRGRWAKVSHSINLDQIDVMFEDGEVVNEQTLREHGFISGECASVKVLGNGELTKKVTLEVNALSKGAQEKLEAAGISYSIVDSKNKSQ